MKTHFLLITDSRERTWLPVIKEALAPLGDLRTEDEADAVNRLRRRRDCVVIIDANRTKDPPGLLSKIRRQFRDLKVVIVTASPDWREARQMFKLGAGDYIYRAMAVNDLRARFQPLQPAPRCTIAKPQPKEQTMQKATILLADDMPKFVNTRKKFLEKAGYKVVTAYTPQDAKRVLNQEEIDLAILDLRMVDGSDPKDISGIIVAREAGRYIPKIILTDHPSWLTSVEAMKPVGGLPPSVDYVFKKDGPTRLLEAIEEALRLRVFIVHGRDNEAKETVARFVEGLGLWAIILHEQAGGGRTIIEKFENHANVGFALVLLTPDDVGGLRGNPKRLKTRARQNVIFELGYFIGKLGRRNVAVLYKKGVEVPSDYQGVEYYPMDKAGAWREALTKEIRRAGILH